MGKRNKKLCPKCGVESIMTRHHVMPKRIYGTVGNHMIVRLCRLCHNALELMIPYNKMPDSFYMNVVRRFFGTYNVPVEGRYHVKDKQDDKSPPRRSKGRTLLRASWKKKSDW